MNKLLFTLLLFGAFSLTTNAQTWDDSGDGWGDDSGSDDNSSGDYDYDQGSGGTTSDYTDTSGGDDWGDDDGFGDDGGFDFGADAGGDYVRSTRPKAEARPYDRFVGMPYDSASQLVTYVEIVDVIVPERFLDLGGDDYSVYDSLYTRAMTWMQTEFGKREAKRMIDAAGADTEGKEGSTIKAYVTIPLKVELNKYQTQDAGTLEFDMELRFKDERYRYKFENFVHVQANTSGKKDKDVTYMEYYLNAKKNIRGNDKILIACNTQVNKLIEGLKATCEATPFIDDDDW
ncbi:MAG: hypothetical protein QMC70_01140 [Bacteroidia bacterium]|jgi:hypothetical protein|tara:strand:- start:6261 stop:7124 length:864 start_codon:yes stop_codon:yes gene_type:complete